MAEPSATVQTSPKESEPVIPPTILKSASLYVGDLPPTVNESAIYGIFVKENITGILSIRVCRDINTRNSLGYAYVNFEDEKKAEQALETLRSPQIGGKPCRIMWSIRDPSIRKSGVGNIFIKNLEVSISNDDLYRLFLDFIKEQKKIELEQSGVPSDSINISDSDVKDEILSCKVACDRNGKSKGYGFVHFARPELAEKAKKKFHGLAFNEKVVFVGDFIPRKDRPVKSNQDTFTNLYIKDLDKEAIKTSDDLENLFKEFGAITSAKLMTDENNVSKGFGFVNFETHEAAVKAIEGRRNYTVAGKVIYVTRALSREERDKELEQQRRAHETALYGTDARKGKIGGISLCNLYVKNLVDKIDDAQLKELFKPFGSITSAKVMVNDNNVSRGFGFVCFSTPEEANAAMTTLDKKLIEGKPLYVAIAQPAQERRRQLDTLHAARGNPRGQGMMPGYPYPAGPVFAAYGRGMGIPTPFPGIPFPGGIPIQGGFRGQPRGRGIPAHLSAGRGMMGGAPGRDIQEMFRSKDPRTILVQITRTLQEKRATLDPNTVTQIEGLLQDIEKEASGGDLRALEGLARQAFSLMSEPQHQM